MSAPKEAWPGALAAATMKLFAACAIDDEDPDRTIGILVAIEDIHSHCPGPREWHTALYTAARVAGVMLRQANGQADPDPISLQFLTLDGSVQTADEVPPAVRFAARWITAAMNDDMDTCMALWFGVDVSAQEAREVTEQMMPMLFTFIGGAVRMFLAAGKPFDASFLLLPKGGTQ